MSTASVHPDESLRSLKPQNVAAKSEIKKVMSRMSDRMSHKSIDSETSGKSMASQKIQSDVSVKTKKKKKKKMKKKKVVAEPKFLASPFDMAGTTRIVIPDYIQKVIGCVVGEDVTAEEQWKYVKKELIEDNLELHDESSIFLPVKKEVLAYPEPLILVGFIPNAASVEDQFFIVLTLEAKQKILRIIAQQKEEIQFRLKRSILRPVGIWKSLGSESEVQDLQLKDLRPLYEIELQSKFPVTDGEVIFRIRNVEDVRDGYIELLPDERYPITTVQKKRIDAQVQATPHKITTEVQTTYPFPTNMATQYDYQYEEPVPTVATVRNMNIFVTGTEANLDEKIEVNQHIDIYDDDYSKLCCYEGSRNKKHDESSGLATFISFCEVATTKNLPVTDAAWCPFVTGLIAVCYSSLSFNSMSNSEETNEDIIPVLIWSHDDNLTPKLHLECSRECTCLSFCPYDKNLVVGGLENGQIVIWDLSGKMEQVESIDILTPAQKKHRMNLSELMHWMKNTYDLAKVQPAAISNLDTSHTNMITAISWLSSHEELTDTGKFNDLSDNSNRQFLTASLDGDIIFWDLNLDSKDSKVKTKRKSKRLKKTPSALTENLSPYARLNKIFIPIFKVKIVHSNKKSPIVRILRSNVPMNEYELEDPDNYDPRPEARTYYKLSEEQNKVLKLPFILGTTLGEIMEIKWEGLEYHSGEAVNVEYATVKLFQHIHDGPMVVTCAHPNLEDTFASIGGTIFAIWRLADQYPLFWRKAKVGKYLGGTWSKDQPTFFILMRSDGVIELWDVLLDTLGPVRTVVIGGDQYLDMFGIFNPEHCRKDTFAISDIIGSMTIYHIPEFMKGDNSDQISVAENYYTHGFNGKAKVRDFIQKYYEQYKQLTTQASETVQSLLQLEKISEDQKDSKLSVEKKFSEIERMDRIFEGIQWNSLNEKVMYESLLRKKKINLEELKVEKIPLQKVITERKEREFKLENIISQKDKIIQTAKTKLFETIYSTKKPTYLVSSSYEFKSCVENFSEIEEQALSYIHNNPYKYEFHWLKVLKAGKKRRNIIYNRPTNYRHTLRKKDKEFVLQKYDYYQYMMDEDRMHEQETVIERFDIEHTSGTVVENLGG